MYEWNSFSIMTWEDSLSIVKIRDAEGNATSYSIPIQDWSTSTYYSYIFQCFNLLFFYGFFTGV